MSMFWTLVNGQVRFTGGAPTVVLGPLGTTSTDGFSLQNTTPATAGATVQISPRLKLSGTAYNSVSTLSETDYFVQEVLPATQAGATTASWMLGASIAGGAVANKLTVASNGVISGANFSATSDFRFGTGTIFSGLALTNGQANLTNNANSAGIGFDVTTDSTLDIKTRAQTAFGTVRAATHNAIGANAQQSIYQQATTLLATTGGAGTVTATNLIPAGSIVFGVDSRVTTIIAGAALTTYKIGDGTTTNAFAATQALAAGTTSDFTTHLSTWKPTLYTAATSIVLTANAGVFSSGAIRLTVHYISLTAATS